MAKTKAKLIAELNEATGELKDLADVVKVNEDLRKQVSDLKEALANLAADKVSGNDPVYLKREVAYLQGQLHQSHLTTKELCRREGKIDKFGHPVPVLAELSDSSRLLVEGLVADVRSLLAVVCNNRDLKQAGIRE